MLSPQELKLLFNLFRMLFRDQLIYKPREPELTHLRDTKINYVKKRYKVKFSTDANLNSWTLHYPSQVKLV